MPTGRIYKSGLSKSAAQAWEADKCYTCYVDPTYEADSRYTGGFSDLAKWIGLSIAKEVLWKKPGDESSGLIGGAVACFVAACCIVVGLAWAVWLIADRSDFRLSNVRGSGYMPIK